MGDASLKWIETAAAIEHAKQQDIQREASKNEISKIKDSPERRALKKSIRDVCVVAEKWNKKYNLGLEKNSKSPISGKLKFSEASFTVREIVGYDDEAMRMYGIQIPEHGYVNRGKIIIVGLRSLFGSSVSEDDFVFRDNVSLDDIEDYHLESVCIALDNLFKDLCDMVDNSLIRKAEVIRGKINEANARYINDNTFSTDHSQKLC